MKVQAILFAIASVAAASGPARNERRTASLERRGDLCGPLDTPMCCETDVLGVADLNCAGISSDVTTTDAFHKTCKVSGKTPECCVLSTLDTAGLLCQEA